MVHIHSTIICLGGWNVAQYFDNAIMFDTETEIWSDAGVMKVPRGRPGASVVNLEDVSDVEGDRAEGVVLAVLLTVKHLDVELA